MHGSVADRSSLRHQKRNAPGAMGVRAFRREPASIGTWSNAEAALERAAEIIGVAETHRSRHTFNRAIGSGKALARFVQTQSPDERRWAAAKLLCKTPRKLPRAERNSFRQSLYAKILIQVTQHPRRQIRKAAA